MRTNKTQPLFQSKALDKKIEDLPSSVFQSINHKDSPDTKEVTYKHFSRKRLLHTLQSSPKSPTPSNIDIYLENNHVINFEHEDVQRLFSRIKINDAHSDFEKVELLRDFVFSFIKNKNLASGFSTASLVSQNRSGDCTEHAIFLAALGRLADIPNRIATGLVYSEQGKPHNGISYVDAILH